MMAPSSEQSKRRLHFMRLGLSRWRAVPWWGRFLAYLHLVAVGALCLWASSLNRVGWSATHLHGDTRILLSGVQSGFGSRWFTSILVDPYPVENQEFTGTLSKDVPLEI